MIPDWFRAVIVTGLQKLLALRLSGTPPEDAIVGTAAAWLEALWTIGCQWDEALDRARMERAFSALLRTCDRWPSPKVFLDHLGHRPPQPQLPPPPLSPAQREANRARLRAIVETLTQPSEPSHEP